jgi:hypothetical protein
MHTGDLNSFLAHRAGNERTLEERLKCTPHQVVEYVRSLKHLRNIQPLPACAKCYWGGHAARAPCAPA